MLVGLYIFIDDDFSDPVYADPDSEELDGTAWEAACEAVNDALDGEGSLTGVEQVGEYLVGWRTRNREGISFVAIVTDDVKPQSVDTYLKAVTRVYFDEVDDPRNPERDGVQDVVVEVIPPWEDDEGE